MYYRSTRGTAGDITSADAIKRGLAPDGGLFVPEVIPRLSPEEIYSLIDMDYKERAVFILSRFLEDYTHEELTECVNSAYGDGKFEGNEVAPIKKLNGIVHMLELWHGPTCAFKDVALQLLPRLLVKAVEKTGETAETVILVATSGDTGKAALEGFKDVKGTRIIVFYPKDGVSQMQKMQMVTQDGGNVSAIAVEGNFDDTQNGVKAIFSDKEFENEMLLKGMKFSSANSINWGRLVPQIVYYFSAYADMVASGQIEKGEKINFTVPTGNFGNILAAWYAREMGLMINKLICASNENNVLTEFINTGKYNRLRDFKKTISPSMDILISSNLERLLYELSEHDETLVNEWMDRLKTEGEYSVTDEVGRKIKELFWSSYSNETEIINTIRDVYEDYNYVVDTHTAVGIDVYDKYVISTGDITKTVIASTASPYKFNVSVAQAILGEEAIEGKTEFELIGLIASKCSMKIPNGLQGLEEKEILHKTVCSKEAMSDEVRRIL